MARTRILLAVVSLLLAACQSDPAAEAGPETTVGASVTTSSILSTTTTEPPTPALVGTDLLTFSEGALLVGSTGFEIALPGAGWQLIDGDPERVTVVTGVGEGVEMTFELPADTTFEAFGVPALVAGASGSTYFASVHISGSDEGPDTGFEPLASIDLSLHSTEADLSAVEVSSIKSVRWVNVRLEGALATEDVLDDSTRVELTEIIGIGTQAVQPHSSAFTGIWEVRRTSDGGETPIRLELTQDGSIVTGCLGPLGLRGVVGGSVARATAADSSGQRSAAVVLVADGVGLRIATISFDDGRFETLSVHEPGDRLGRDCTPPTSVTAVCEAPLYVNFAYDSAEIRSDSEQAIADIHRILGELGVSAVVVVGHTSTEGSEDHNLDLSRMRAIAVADELVALGFPTAGITTEGRGETEPLVVPDTDEASRSINRRVELECT